jgi:hypothetical protein
VRTDAGRGRLIVPQPEVDGTGVPLELVRHFASRALASVRGRHTQSAGSKNGDEDGRTQAVATIGRRTHSPVIPTRSRAAGAPGAEGCGNVRHTGRGPSGGSTPWARALVRSDPRGGQADDDDRDLRRPPTCPFPKGMRVLALRDPVPYQGVQALVLAAIADVHATGEYPSRPRVQDHLPSNVSLRDPRLERLWKNEVTGLGFPRPSLPVRPGRGAGRAA